MTPPKDMTAQMLLDELTQLRESRRDLEQEHEGLFMQREELTKAEGEKLSELKTVMKEQGLEYIENAQWAAVAQVSYKKVQPNWELLAKLHEQLVEDGTIVKVETTLTKYVPNPEMVKLAQQSGRISQDDLDAVTPERTVHAVQISIVDKTAR